MFEPENLWSSGDYDKQSLVFLVTIFLLFREKISEFRFNCIKFTQYFAVDFIIIIIIREPIVT